ncbi:hypothetical protein DAEQUDRAFT_121630 [Daedalea quercina L-15889]|uniref:Protection of telomeres protein 1 n=1 Tax=Daedalea quercina L-15889 TaxID=1314783 RepID=A0A165RWW3_9APHY|nr:hypothetical protein DAEQUDRAFT_121630 [Daedalea quercina L-15889]
MKRAVDADQVTPTKRRRASGEHDNGLNSEVVFSDPSRECGIEDILRGGVQPDNYVVGEVFMRQPPQNGRMWFILKTSSGLRVSVTFTGKCARYLDVLLCNFRDVMRLRTKGAVVTETNESLSLLYEQGASMMFVKTRNNTRDGQIVDTWNLEEEAERLSSDYVDGDDWYGTPSRPQHQSSDPTLGAPVENVESTTVSVEGSANPVIPPQEAMSSRLAASTSSFSPSVQLAATRRSTSIAPPTLPNFTTNVGTEPETYALKPNSETTKPSSRRVASGVNEGTHPKAPSDVSACESPTSKHFDISLASQHDRTASEPVPEQNALRGPSRPSENELHQKETVPLSKKGGKARRRRLKRMHRASGGEKVREEQPQVSLSPTAIRTSNPEQADASAGNVYDERPQGSPNKEENSTDNTGARVSAKNGKAANTSHSPKPPVDHTPEPKPSASSKPTPSVPSTCITLKAETADIPPPLAGFRSEYGFYAPLAKVETKDKVYNITAIVIAPGFIAQTCMGEFKTILGLTDPSVHEQCDFSVNLFARKASQLPEAARGDIIMIRGILGDYYRRKCGTAPSYKSWSWAVVDPTRKEPAPKKGDINFTPTPLELQHCASLGEWWSSVGPAQNLGVVHQIRPARTGRIHRLLSEASPDCDPDGYFDCTVEVLYGHENSNGIYSLYITDYTQNPDMVPVERDWCPPMLHDKVLKLELFLDAAKKGPELKAGHYYFIGNCRMKRSTGGYLEATFSQVNKIRKLDDDALEDDTRLAALLQRKAEWQEKVEANGGAHEFPHLLFEQAEENKHFRCTAEILSISPKDQTTYLYVTDYTRRDDLAPIAFTVPRARELQNRVVKISLHDEQAETAKQLEVADFVAIRNLRLRPSGSEKKLTGRLGGNQRLLNKLQPNTANNHELKALLMRKEEFELRKNVVHAPDRGKRKQRADRLPEKPHSRGDKEARDGGI